MTKEFLRKEEVSGILRIGFFLLVLGFLLLISHFVLKAKKI
jgi:hypothetical protein